MTTIVATITAAVLAMLAISAIGDRKRRQRIADQQWRDVEGE